MIAPLPYAIEQKPGSCTLPLPGVQPAILDDNGQEIGGVGSGVLVIKTSWPGMMRSLYNDHERFETNYFWPYPGYYFTGDSVRTLYRIFLFLRTAWCFCSHVNLSCTGFLTNL